MKRVWYGTLKRRCAVLERVAWYFGEGGGTFEDGVLLLRVWRGTLNKVALYFGEGGLVLLKSVVWYFEEGGVVL